LHRVPFPLAGLRRQTSIRTLRARLLTHWLPVLLWAALIFGLSSIPSLSSGLGVWDTILRKGAHMTEYAILAALLARALGRALPAFALAVAYSASDEFHQTFVRGRHGSPIDVGIDTIGILVGLGLWSRRR
jgi:VanZ family protein